MYGFNPNQAADLAISDDEALKRLARMLRDTGYGGLNSALRRMFGNGFFGGPLFSGGRGRGGSSVAPGGGGSSGPPSSGGGGGPSSIPTI